MLLLNMQNVNFSMLLYTMLIKHTGLEEPFLTHCLILTKFSKLFKSYDYNVFFFRETTLHIVSRDLRIS